MIELDQTLKWMHMKLFESIPRTHQHDQKKNVFLVFPMPRFHWILKTQFFAEQFPILQSMKWSTRFWKPALQPQVHSELDKNFRDGSILANIIFAWIQLQSTDRLFVKAV